MNTDAGLPVGDKLLPSVATVKGGKVIKSDAQGFGLEIPEEWIVSSDQGN